MADLLPFDKLPGGKVADLVAKEIMLLHQEGVLLPPAALVAAGVVGILKARGAIDTVGHFVELPAATWAGIAADVLALLAETGVTIPPELTQVVQALPVIFVLVPALQPKPHQPIEIK